jgi:hypothetical protein
VKESDEHRLAQLTVAIVLAGAVGAAVVLVAVLVAVLVGVETVTPIEDVRSSRVEAEDVHISFFLSCSFCGVGYIGC